MSSSTKNNFISSIHALRAIAFLAIFTYHCGLLPTGPWAVTVFFLISGFCMYYIYHEKIPTSYTVKDCFKFSFQKISKLYPLHIIMMIFVIIRSFLERGYAPTDLPRIFCDSLLLTSWIPTNLGIIPYNGVSWYLSTSALQYFCFFEIAKKLIKQPIKKVYIIILSVFSLQTITLIVLNCICNLPENIVHWVAYEFPIYRLGDFIIGCCLGKIFIERKEKNFSFKIANLQEIACIAFVLLTLLIYTLKVGFLGSNPIRASILLLPSAALTVYLFALKKGAFTRILTNKVFCWIADLSAYGFLIHQVVIFQTKLFLFGGDEWKGYTQKLIVFGISFIITTILVIIYKHFSETIKFKKVKTY